MSLDALYAPHPETDMIKWFTDLADCTGWSQWVEVGKQIAKKCGTKVCGDLYMEDEFDIDEALDAAKVCAVPVQSPPPTFLL